MRDNGGEEIKGVNGVLYYIFSFGAMMEISSLKRMIIVENSDDTQELIMTLNVPYVDCNHLGPDQHID